MYTEDQQNQWHVLDFTCDDDGNSSITILYQATRFHVIVDTNNLHLKTEAGAEYLSFVDDYRRSIGCEVINRKTCDSKSDSGVDVSSPKSGEEDEPVEEDDPVDAETALQRWMVAPLEDSLDDLVEATDSNRALTLQQWYHCPTRFCGLFVSDDGSEIEARELEQISKRKQKVDSLIPALTLPKSIAEKMEVPYHLASNFEVLEGSDQPPGTPYHPCLVQHCKTKKKYFLKLVDNNQHAASKRELQILQRIRDLRLGERIRTPILEGIVCFDNAKKTAAGKKKIMGFLQTPVPDATPLTLMFDPSISQEKRDGWAREAEQYVKVLHENGIVWGDSKADNFVVDKHDKLWIIDFGGSRTEGWVDAELNETKEGDEMGVRKTVNGLKDPVNNCVRADVEEEKGGSEERKGGKRKRKKSEAATNQEDSQKKKKSRRR